MSIPIIKVIIVSFRYASRPLVNTLKRSIKSRNDDGTRSFAARSLIWVGQKAHRFEYNLNYYIINDESKVAKDNVPIENEKSSEKNEMSEKQKSRGDPFLKPLNSDAAFNKGTEYLTEMVFFYGVLISIAIWEINKNQQIGKFNMARKKQLQENLKYLTRNVQNAEKKVESGRLDLIEKSILISHLDSEIQNLQAKIEKQKEDMKM